MPDRKVGVWKKGFENYTLKKCSRSTEYCIRRTVIFSILNIWAYKNRLRNLIYFCMDTQQFVFIWFYLFLSSPILRHAEIHFTFACHKQNECKSHLKNLPDERPSHFFLIFIVFMLLLFTWSVMKNYNYEMNVASKSDVFHVIKLEITLTLNYKNIKAYRQELSLPPRIYCNKRRRRKKKWKII